MVTDPDWLDNYLRPALKKATAHIIRIGAPFMNLTTSSFRIMGFDFMLDTDFKLWFIEGNYAPQLFDDSPVIPEIWAHNEKMLTDKFDIIHALLRSRVNRIRTFMLEFVRDYMIPKKPYNLAQKRAEYFELSKDKFDPQFPISEDNSWSPVIDLTKPLKEAYFGHIEPECL